MDLTPYFKSVLEQDICAVVICDLEHKIIYMNPEAKRRYARWSGAALLGKSLLECHNPESQTMIRKVVAWFLESREHNRMFTFHNSKENKDVYMIALRADDGTLIGYYEKHEFRNAETEEPYHF